MHGSRLGTRAKLPAPVSGSGAGTTGLHCRARLRLRLSDSARARPSAAAPAAGEALLFPTGCGASRRASPRGRVSEAYRTRRARPAARPGRWHRPHSGRSRQRPLACVRCSRQRTCTRDSHCSKVKVQARAGDQAWFNVRFSRVGLRCCSTWIAPSRLPPCARLHRHSP